MVLTQAIQNSPSTFESKLQSYLLAISKSTESKSSLQKVAASILADREFLATALAKKPPLPIDGTPYSRHVLFQSELGDVMIASWPAGSQCMPHDHGGAHGVVTALKGTFYEQGFSISGPFRPVGSERAFQTGEMRLVEPKEIHGLRAGVEGVTLHLYAPQVRGMKVYDEPNRAIYTVAENCGAWVPRDKSLIVRTESLSSTRALHN